MKDTCPYCLVDGDFHGVAEFIPARVRCGNCIRVYLYIPSVWERLDREPYEGRANEVYLRPRWRTDLPKPSPLPNPRERAVRALHRYSVKTLVWMLHAASRYDELPSWEDIKAALNTKPHVEFDRRKRSAQRRAMAQRNHGCSKSKNR